VFGRIVSCLRGGCDTVVVEKEWREAKGGSRGARGSVEGSFGDKTRENFDGPRGLTLWCLSKR